MGKYYFRESLKTKNINKTNVIEKKYQLSLNEAPFNPLNLLSENDKNDILNFEINRYPKEELKNQLKNELIKYNKENNYLKINIKNENFLLGNGIDEILYYLFVSIASKQAKILISMPTYFDYITYAESTGLTIEKIYLKDEFELDPELIIKKVKKDKNIKMIIICNPNNPTGNLFKDSDIFYILENIEDRLVVIDEAYLEFSNKTFVNSINLYENLVILRSFSKGFFASGLRFGYLIANSIIVNELKKVKMIFNLSSLSMFVALKLLKNHKKIATYRKKLINTREYLFSEMKKIENIKPFKSFTNFILFKLYENYNSEELYRYLLKNDISIRDVSKLPLLNNCLRVSIGLENEILYFLNVLNQFFN